MSNLLRIILVVALALFIVGFIWAVVTAVRNPKKVAEKPEEKKTEQPAPVNPQPTPTPATETPKPTEQIPASGNPSPAVGKPSTSARQQQTYVITEEVIIEEPSSSAWTSADGEHTYERTWVDENGTLHSEARAWSD